MTRREISQLKHVVGFVWLLLGGRIVSAFIIISPAIVHNVNQYPSYTTYHQHQHYKPVIINNNKAIKRTTTICHLFFRAREEEALKKKRRTAQATIPDRAFEELKSKDAPIPYTFSLSDENEESIATDPSKLSTTSSVLQIRLLKTEDLDEIVPLCVNEFGGGPTSLEYFFDNFPWNESYKVQQQFFYDWWENYVLPSFIYWTFRFKIVDRNPQDHALLVATLQQATATITYDNQRNLLESKDAKTDDTTTNIGSRDKCVIGDTENSVLVGLVEVSKQPPEANRNPTAYPLPLWYKTMYCWIKNIPAPDGWVTNLLVAPDFRGQGYSKLLMAAAEGVARTWGCTAIHLHCDADRVSGQVPQRLYKALGYDMVEDKNSPFAWMGSEFSNKIYMVENVALLYFRKILT